MFSCGAVGNSTSEVLQLPAVRTGDLKRRVWIHSSAARRCGQHGLRCAEAPPSDIDGVLLVEHWDFTADDLPELGCEPMEHEADCMVLGTKDSTRAGSSVTGEPVVIPSDHHAGTGAWDPPIVRDLLL